MCMTQTQMPPRRLRHGGETKTDRCRLVFLFLIGNVDIWTLVGGVTLTVGVGGSAMQLIYQCKSYIHTAVSLQNCLPANAALLLPLITAIQKEKKGTEKLRERQTEQHKLSKPAPSADITGSKVAINHETWLQYGELLPQLTSPPCNPINVPVMDDSA